MLKKSFKSFILILYIAFLFGCENTSVSSTYPENTQSINIESYVAYTYSDSITQEEKLEFVNMNSHNIEILLENCILNEEVLNYYISNESYNYYNIRTNTIYLNINDYATFDAILYPIINIHSTYTNYGLMYGLSYFLSNELGYVDSDTHINETSIPDYLFDEGNDYMHELLYPFFNEDYSTESQIRDAKEFSIIISNYIITNFSMDNFLSLLSNTDDFEEFDSSFVSYKNLWLESLEYESTIYSSEFPVQFSWEHVYSKLEWRTSHGFFVINNDFEDDLYGENYGAYSLLNNINSLMITINQFEYEMTQADILLKDENTEYPNLSVTFTFRLNMSFYNGQGEITVMTLGTFLHEYIHYLTAHYMDIAGDSNKWLFEAVAHYFQNTSLFVQTVIDNALITDQNEHGADSFLSIFSDHYAYEFDCSINVYEMYDIFQYLSNNYDGVTEYHSDYHIQYISFFNHIIETYGFDTFMEILVDQTLMDEYLSNDWDGLILEWETNIKANYVWLDNYLS
ncbi:MAG: hypothetical protein JEZ05_00385 [Tenericutes bacterium]|nr:hypothetical protein [Mycoplasmatota bacterium]